MKAPPAAIPAPANPKGGRIVNGVGADTDVIVASAKAYISALNKLASKVERLNPQHQL